MAADCLSVTVFVQNERRAMWMKLWARSKGTLAKGSKTRCIKWPKTINLSGWKSGQWE